MQLSCHKIAPASRQLPRYHLLPGVFPHAKSSETDLHVTHQMTLNELLVKAARENKRKTTSQLLGPSIDSNGDTGVNGSSVYAAAASGHSNLVTLLLDHRAAASARSNKYFPPLIIAAAEGHTMSHSML